MSLSKNAATRNRPEPVHGGRLIRVQRWTAMVQSTISSSISLCSSICLQFYSNTFLSLHLIADDGIASLTGSSVIGWRCCRARIVAIDDAVARVSVCQSGGRLLLDLFARWRHFDAALVTIHYCSHLLRFSLKPRKTAELSQVAGGRICWQTQLPVSKPSCFRFISGYASRAGDKQNCRLEDQSNIVKVRRLTLAGHILQLPPGRPASVAMQWVPDGGKRRRGRQTFKEDLQELESAGVVFREWPVIGGSGKSSSLSTPAGVERPKFKVMLPLVSGEQERFSKMRRCRLSKFCGEHRGTLVPSAICIGRQAYCSNRDIRMCTLHNRDVRRPIIPVHYASAIPWCCSG